MKKTPAERLARELIREHAPGWRFAWLPRSKAVFGRCSYVQSKSYAAKTIYLSLHLTLINDEPMVRWVLLHEIAHALAGPHSNHGPVWRVHARRLGIKPSRCWDTNMGDGLKPVAIEGNILGTCELGCGYIIRKHRISWSSYDRGICPECSNRAERIWVYLDWTRSDGTPVPPSKKPAPRRRRSRRRAYSW